MSATPEAHDPAQNHLIAALSVAARNRLQPHLELVQLPLGKVLYESGSVLQHVYFPTDSIVSLLYILENGASAEIAVVGNEGVVGVALFMGGDTTPSRAVVQSAGYGYRLDKSILMQEFHRAYGRSGDPAAALRVAQLRMLHHPNRALRSPAYWAGFRYMGS